MKKDLVSLIIACVSVLGAFTAPAYADSSERVCLCVVVQEDVSKVLVTDAIKAAYWLKRLRAGYDEVILYQFAYNKMMLSLEIEGLTLDDLNTSEGELKELKIATARREAAKWLSFLRDGNSYVSYDYTLEFMFKAMSLGKLTLDDLNTSEGELKELKIATARREARRIFNGLRNGTDRSSAEVILSSLHKALKDGQMTFKDLDQI